MFPIRKFSFFYFISFPFLHILPPFPPSLIPTMSTEEVQVSRKRAASEEAEVTITVKAKKSDFPVTATITLVSVYVSK